MLFILFTANMYLGFTIANIGPICVNILNYILYDQKFTRRILSGNILGFLGVLLMINSSYIMYLYTG